MNGYLFDTDALSQPLKKKPSAVFVSRVAEVPPAMQLTSAITVAELIYGAHRLPEPGRLLERIERLLSEVRVLPFDAEAAAICGRLRAFLEGQGTPVATSDLMIASIAVSANLVLVTGNGRHFGRVPGLAIEDWIRS